MKNVKKDEVMIGMMKRDEMALKKLNKFKYNDTTLILVLGF